MLLNKHLENKTTFIFDFFHTLTKPETEWGNYFWTSDCLGIDKNIWGEKLELDSTDRLTGKITQSFDIIKEIASRIDPDISDERIQNASEINIDRFNKAVLDIPQYVVETLSKLKFRGKKIGLISNADCTEFAEWPNCPIAKLFDSVILSFEVGYIKPQKEIYELSLKSLNSNPAESIFIGNGGSNELEGAKNCGLTTIFVEGIAKEWLSNDTIKYRRNIADYTINFISDII